MKIQQIEYDRTKGKSFDEWIDELYENNNVYLLFNRYSTIRSFYERSKNLNPEEIKYENCWRMIPFKDYYNRNKDNSFFKDTFQIRLGQKMVLVSIEF